MPKYIIFNIVNNDGVGDFTHFEDIMKVLLSDSKYKGVEFIPIVCFNSYGNVSNYTRIGKKMNELSVEFFYYGNETAHEGFSKDITLQKHLSDADQYIVISFNQVLQCYMPYFKEGIPLKVISEHEEWGPHSLGLGPGRAGIKIQPYSRINPHVAWGIITENDPEFSTQLLTLTNLQTFNNFNESHVVIPAYFNKADAFIRFLYLLAVNQSFPKDKDIFICLSGLNIVSLVENNEIKNVLMYSNIGRIELIRLGNDSPEIIHHNQDGLKTVRIISGYLSEPSFNAIYQLANIAGVSGDNTFERCVSMNILPFYWSTNSHKKGPTLVALQRITQLPELNISSEARESFNIFFSLSAPNKVYQEHNYPLLDLPKMIKAWPTVTAWLRQNKNFYNNMERIILEKLPLEAQPTFFVKKANVQATQEARQTASTLKQEPDNGLFIPKL